MTPRLPWPGLAAAAAAFTLHFTLQCLTPIAGAAQAIAQRAIIVISDLHMGGGRDEAGRWRRDEDFRWAGEFSEFLRTIDAQHRSTVDLVLNGDTFNLPADETEAMASLDRALTAHSAEMEALAGFAKQGTNRIVLIPGDRDAALRFGKVAERVVRALRSQPDRVTAAASGYWLSQDADANMARSVSVRRAPKKSTKLEAAYPLTTWPLRGQCQKCALMKNSQQWDAAALQ